LAEDVVGDGPDVVLLISVLVVVVSSSFLAPSEVNTCDISEFRCPSKDGQGTLCLPMDRWCNGKDECDNRVDEPRSCTSQYHLFLYIKIYNYYYFRSDIIYTFEII
jgi:hypothetical protein